MTADPTESGGNEATQNLAQPVTTATEPSAPLAAQDAAPMVTEAAAQLPTSPAAEPAGGGTVSPVPRPRRVIDMRRPRRPAAEATSSKTTGPRPSPVAAQAKPPLAPEPERGSERPSFERRPRPSHERPRRADVRSYRSERREEAPFHPTDPVPTPASPGGRQEPSLPKKPVPEKPVLAPVPPPAPLPPVKASPDPEPAWIPPQRKPVYPKKKKAALTPKEALRRKVQHHAAKLPHKPTHDALGSASSPAREAIDGTAAPAEKPHETTPRLKVPVGAEGKKSTPSQAPKAKAKETKPVAKEVPKESVAEPKPGLWEKIVRIFRRTTKKPAERG